MAGRDDCAIADALQALAQAMAQNGQNNQAVEVPDEFRALGRF